MIGSTGRSLKEKEIEGKDYGDSIQLQVGTLITCRPLRGETVHTCGSMFHFNK